MHILIDGGKYFFYNDLRIEKELPVRNYEFCFDVKGNCWLQDMAAFSFPEKIYEVDSEMRSIVLKSFNSENKNLGVLLTGNKGQGKSLNAKLICRDINLPIICITKPIPAGVSFVSFLSNIKQDYVLYIDEFEKLFKTSGIDDDGDAYSNDDGKGHSQESFLTFMDGSVSSENKTLFLLTTNGMVNEYMINRPSRIKFVKEYDELPEDLFNSICQDKLIGHLKKDEYIKDLEENTSLINLNIDVLISILTDIKLLDLPFSKFQNIYNYSMQGSRYEVYVKTDDGPEEPHSIATIRGKIKPDQYYVCDFKVTRFLKLEKSEIIFESNYKPMKGNKMAVRTVRLVPYTSMSKSANKEAFVL